MNQPDPMPRVPSYKVPEDDPDENLEGTNKTIHHPDPHAEEHPARETHKTPGPYVTGND
ncbi:MAG: hypothetical protein JWP22_1475 [Ramlibacter sp.]|jgi:hypothetical protein|nr:hypothetical protein [Ramlibacter sp.]MDB5912800.1 hypothetical protein [Ramlibacter sp.]